MPGVSIAQDRVHIGERFSVSFQRTLRIPDDGRTYPLPPGLGAFPVHSVEDYKDRVPASWREQGGVFIPMHQGEALWLGFDGASWKPNAVKVAVGMVNAVSGEMWDERLHDGPQDYIVCPQQPWLDGINAAGGSIRQFVAMPLGLGYTVEAQVTGTEQFGGIQVLVFEPKPGRFPDRPPAASTIGTAMSLASAAAPPPGMGLGAGGKIAQKIYPDPFGIDTWDQSNYGKLYAHIVNTEQYRQLTGLEPPPTPVSAQTYAKYGLPWFELYDEAMGDLPAPDTLTNVKSIKEIDRERGSAYAKDDEPVDVDQSSIQKLRHKGLNESEIEFPGGN